MKIIEHDGAPITTPGLYRMTAAAYHADPCAEPSLSSSIARTLINETERHAYASHPRLGGTAEDPKKRKLDIGTVAHELLTGQGRGIHVIEALDKDGKPVTTYATKAAQAERDAAVERGETPVLPGDLVLAERMVEAIRAKCEVTAETERAFQHGHGELALFWRDRTGVWGRALLDWFDPETAAVDDLKTTSGGLSDRALHNRIIEGLDVQDAWYRRGLAHLIPELSGRIRFRFHFVETDAPHEGRIITLTGEQQSLGARKVVAAAVAFRECLRSGDWPGYPDTVERLPSPDWVEARHLEFEMSGTLHRRYGAQILLAQSPFVPTHEAA